MTVEGFKCVRFSLPDDPDWMAMFWGALYQLTAWNSYDRDGSESGAYVAGVWRSIFESARSEGCDLIEFQLVSPCELQVSTDGGATWRTIYNGLDCIISAIDSGVINAGPNAPWEFTYDFTAGTQGFTASIGHYASGQGFATDSFVSEGKGYAMLDVHGNFPQTGHVTRYVAEYVFNVGENGCPTIASGDYISFFDATPASPFAVTYCPAESSPWIVNRDAEVNQVGMRLFPGWRGDAVAPTGDAVLQRITIQGLGINPFS